ncbi:MAG: hypothetical protein Q7S29_05370 [Candidatus Peribacter sp.]|nr:hypothetical protein [Candidatus Peribacter sp.]
MEVEQTDKGQICVFPVRAQRSHVDLERALGSMGIRVHVSPPDREGQMCVRAVVDRANQDNAAQIRAMLEQEKCEVMERT